MSFKNQHLSESENPAQTSLFQFHNNTAYMAYQKSVAVKHTVLSAPFKFHENFISFQYASCRGVP